MRCIFINRTIGMTSFSIGTNRTINTNGPSVWRIVSVCVYILDMCENWGLAKSRFWQKFERTTLLITWSAAALGPDLTNPDTFLYESAELPSTRNPAVNPHTGTAYFKNRPPEWPLCSIYLQQHSKRGLNIWLGWRKPNLISSNGCRVNPRRKYHAVSACRDSCGRGHNVKQNTNSPFKQVNVNFLTC